MTKKSFTIVAALTAVLFLSQPAPAQASAPCAAKKIPSVVGLRAKDATVKLQNAGFYKIRITGFTEPYKVVSSQLPRAGAWVTPCGPVFLTKA